MKKVILIACVLLCGSYACHATESLSPSTSEAMTTAGDNIPSNYQGFYKAGSGNWIRVNSNFVKINGQDYEVKVQNGNGSIVLSLYIKTGGTLNPQYEYAGSITIYSDGSLYYNNEAYYK